MRHATSTARSTRSSNIEGCEGYGSSGLVRTLRIRIMEEEATVSVLMACAHGMCFSMVRIACACGMPHLGCWIWHRREVLVPTPPWHGDFARKRTAVTGDVSQQGDPDPLARRKTRCGTAVAVR